MNLIAKVANWFRSLENPRRPLDPWSQALGDSLDGTLSLSGQRVSPKKALLSAGWWRGINLISGTVAKLPLGVYRRKNPGSEIDRDHPAHRLLRRSPNEYMTAFVWKRLMQGLLLGHGNAYSYVERRVSGDPVALLPLDPEKTYPVREGAKLWYVHELKDGSRLKLDSDDVIHLKGYSEDGLEGISVIRRAAREVLGLDLATRGYASTFFRNSARPNVALKHPGRISKEARQALRESWERLHSGVDNAHRAAILEEGMELIEFSVNARDSQLLESRQFSLIEIANVLQIPPHKLGAATNVSYKSLEEENQAYLDDGVDTWLVMWEEELEAKLLGVYQRERETHAVAFDRFPLVRANQQQRGAYYVQALSNGWMSHDEVRDREGMNPIPGGLGGIYYRPANLTPINLDPDGPEGPAVAPGTTLIPVPDVRQESDYDCGPAAVQAVCAHFGVGPSSRQEFAEDLDASRSGTRPTAIVDFLSRFDLAVTAKSKLTVVDLARFFASGQPVLCPIQVGDEPTVGHWVVVVGAGLGQVFFHDPAVGLRLLAEEEWNRRWYDSDSEGVRFEQYGIAVGRELLTATPSAPKEEEVEKPKENDESVRSAIAAVARDCVVRMVRRVGHAATRAAAKPSKFLDWLNSLESDHRTTVEQSLSPVVRLVKSSGASPAESAEVIAGLLIEELREELLELSGEATQASLAASVERWLGKVETKPEALKAYRAILGE